VCAFQRIAKAIVVLASLAMLPTQASADPLSATAQRIHRSLVFIESKEQGTGFVVSSNKTTSLIVTAAHILVGSTPAELSACERHDARVSLDDGTTFIDTSSVTYVKVECESDLALLQIPVGSLITVHFATEAPEGTPVATIGYPISTEYFSEGELRHPKVVDGIITAVHENYELVEHSVPTDFGNSGGPIFESSDGYVVGIVAGEALQFKASNLFTGFRLILRLLDATRVQRTENLLLIPADQQGTAYKFLLMTEGNARDSFSQQLDAELASDVARMLHVSVAKAPPGPRRADGTPPDCEKHAIGVVDVDLRNVRQSKSGVSGTVTVKFGDCSATPWSKRTYPIAGNASIHSSVSQIAGQLIRDLGQGRAERPTALANYAHYGVEIADTELRSLYSLEPDGKTQAKVLALYPIGTAARAGLRANDVVISVNGKPTATSSDDPLTAYSELSVLLDQAADPVHLCILRGGQQMELPPFYRRDVLWYATNPLSAEKLEPPLSGCEART
jgi:S1-C subfamily serine protease